MKLEYCDEHENCTIVDGEHTSRRAPLLPPGLVQQDQVDALKKDVNTKLRNLAVEGQERFKDTSEKIEVSHNALAALLKDLKQALAALQTEFYEFREDANRKLGQAIDEKKSVPGTVKTLGRQVAKIDKQFGAVTDKLIKLDEAIEQETAAREAVIKQLVEL